MNFRARATALMVVVLGTACQPPAVDCTVSGCPTSQRCDAPTRLCVRGERADASVPDAGAAPDGGLSPADAGLPGDVDAGAVDAGLVDAGLVDAGSAVDGGEPVDAGSGLDAGSLAPPQLTGLTPAGPANANLVSVAGTTVAGATVLLFTAAGCQGASMASTTATSAGLFSLSVSVADDTVTSLSVRATTADGSSSPCSAALVYVEDSSPPVVPHTVTFSPSSPSWSTAPVVRGVTEPGALVRVYLNDTICGGPPHVATTADDAGVFSVGLVVVANQTTPVHASAIDVAANASLCSPVASFVNDSVPPSTPAFSGPVASANDNLPLFSGSVSESSMVSLYTSAQCTGAAVASTSSPGTTFAITVPVADDSTTALHARATDLAGNDSPCSAARTYVEDSQPPSAPVWSSPGPTANNNAPLFGGAVEVGATVSLYADAGCTGTALASLVATGGTYSFVQSVADNTTVTRSVRAVDGAGNASACANRTYVEDSIAPAAPLWTGPSSPANENLPSFTGTTEAGATVQLFTSTNCSGAAVATTTATAGGVFAASYSVSNNSITTLYARATDAAGNGSGCSAGRTFLEDSVAPSTPTVQLIPAGPANYNSPEVTGITDANSTVRIYKTTACTGAPDATTIANGAGLYSVAVNVADNSTTVFRVSVTDPAGNVSGCGSATYVENSSLPMEPVFTGSTPASPANHTNPTLHGNAEDGATVSIYAGGACGGAALASGVASGGVFSIAVSVSDDSSTVFSAKAVNALMTASPCGAVTLTYVEDSTPPAAPVVTGTLPVGPANDNNPRVYGTTSDVTAAHTVHGTAGCLDGPRPATGGLDGGTFAFVVNVLNDSTTSFYVRATDVAGNASCSSSFASYVEDSTPPTPPSSFSSTPASPAANATPTVTVGAEVGAVVSLFTNASCTSADAGSALASTATVDIQVRVPQAASTTFWARAVDAVGNVGACSSASFTYVENTPVTAPLYAGSTGWNHYVVNDGATVLAATNTPCSGAQTGYLGCLHAGAMRQVSVPGVGSCTGIAAVDALGALRWVCDGSTNPVRVVSLGLAPGKHLSDLLDFTTVGWKPNTVTVTQSSTPVLVTAPQVFFSNPVVAWNGSGALSTAGTVYLVSANLNAAAPADLQADRVALVVKPPAALSSASGTSVVTQSSARLFTWLEGHFNAVGRSLGIEAGGGWLVLDQVRVTSAQVGALSLQSARSVYGRGVTLANNQSGGLIAAHASTFVDLASYNNVATALTVSGDDDRLTSLLISSSGNGLVVSGKNAVVSNATITRVGTALDVSGGYAWLRNVVAVANVDGLALSGGAATVENLTVANNSATGVAVTSSGNRFTGRLAIGANGTADCAAGASAGLTNACVAQGASDFGSAVTVTTTSSFLGLVAADDAVNTSDTPAGTAFAAIADWLGFENRFRVWGRAVGGLACTSGTCQLWDHRLNLADTVLQGALGCASGLSPSPSLTHTFEATTTPAVLRNALEVFDDGVGDDDGLCESNEACVQLQNSGVFPGTGALTSSACLSGGGVSGVTGWAYPSNH